MGEAFFQQSCHETVVTFRTVVGGDPQVAAMRAECIRQNHGRGGAEPEDCGCAAARPRRQFKQGRHADPAADQYDRLAGRRGKPIAKRPEQVDLLPLPDQ